MHRPRLSTSLALVCLAAATHLGWADPNPYYVGVSQTFSHDTNFLRLADGQSLPTVPAGLSKSESISTTALLAGLDQTISRQHLFGNVTLRSNRLSNNTLYDSQGYAFAGGLDWETVNDISGSINASANRNLAGFNAAQVSAPTTKNLQSTQQVDAAFRMGVVTAWTVEATLGERGVKYSAPEYVTQEFHQTSASLGLHYRPNPGTNFGVALRDAHGEYPNFFPVGNGIYQSDAYNRRDIDFTAFLAASGASDLSARVSVGKTGYDIATDRDFSGVTGRITWLWKPTGKLRLTTELTRDPGQDSYFASGSNDATVDYTRLTTALSVRGAYELASKITLNSSIAFAGRSITQTLPPVAGFNNQISTSDKSTNLTFGGSWVPTRALTLGCDLGRYQRSGVAPLSSDLHDTTYSCYGQFTLQ